MFVESHYILNLSLFKKELTKQIINEAYDKLLKEYICYIRKGLEPPFELSVKKEAKDYLLNNIKPQK